MNEKIPFNRPYTTGNELIYIAEANSKHVLAGDGVYTIRCHEWLHNITGCNKALLTHSCTAALELAALLLDIKAGDEIIMPSYTFVSTANAFVLRGGVPVFVDIREDTLNLDERLIEAAITPRTRAIVPVHYAGVSCEMDSIKEIANKYNLKIVEDSAQGIMSRYKGRMLGSLGEMAAYSFHETKNLISGEGGALLINDPALTSRAEILREKGTNRSSFFRGEVDKYTWQDVGSSFLPSEITASFLYAQFEEAENITSNRLKIWNYYHELFCSLEINGFVKRPTVPEYCQHNAHIYYLILSADFDRKSVLTKLKSNGIHALSHYIPLHSSPGGILYGKSHGSLDVTVRQSERLIRLPIWIGLSQMQQDRIADVLNNILTS